MAGSCSDLPVEIIEIILETFILTTPPTVENRAAILRVCRLWYEIAEPLIYRHISIFEGHDELDALESLAQMLDKYPSYATRTESFTVRISRANLWLVSMSAEIPDQFRYVGWMQNIKHFSINITVADSEDGHYARCLVGSFINDISPSCQSFEVKIDTSDRNVLSFETQLNPGAVQNIPNTLRSLRMEALTDQTPILEALTRRVFKNLEEVVIKSDKLKQSSDRDYRRIWYPRNEMSAFIEHIVEVLQSGNMPALKRLLMYRERSTINNFGPDNNVNDLLQHVKPLTYEDLYHLLLREGGVNDRDYAVECANKAKQANEMSDGKVRRQSNMGDKWLVYSHPARAEEDLVGVLYTFKSYPFYYQTVEDHGCFFWCSAVNGTRVPVNEIVNSELSRATTEIPPSRRNFETQPMTGIMTRVNYIVGKSLTGVLSGVLFKACRDQSVALMDD